ncbi:MAG: cation:proton antiporter [Pseudonocardiaceae bacterium]
MLEDFAMAIYLPVLAVLAAGGTRWQALIGILVALAALQAAVTSAAFWPLTPSFFASRRWGHRIGGALSHPESEQIMLRVLGITLVVAALAETVNISAAVGAFLVGLSLTGEITDRAREALTPLRDLFAAAFFLAIGLSIKSADLPDVLPTAFALAAVTAITKIFTGAFAARRDRPRQAGAASRRDRADRTRRVFYRRGRADRYRRRSPAGCARRRLCPARGHLGTDRHKACRSLRRHPEVRQPHAHDCWFGSARLGRRLRRWESCTTTNTTWSPWPS